MVPRCTGNTDPLMNSCSRHMAVNTFDAPSTWVMPSVTDFQPVDVNDADVFGPPYSMTDKAPSL